MVSSRQKNQTSRIKFSAGEEKSRHQMEEFGGGEKGFIFCPFGEAVYYKKAWRHSGDFFSQSLNLSADKSVKFKICPAHLLIKNNQYEGKVVLSKIPANLKKEIINLIKKMGEQAFARDVLDRIMKISASGQQMVVYTSENQLAQKIGRKIERTYRKKIIRKNKRASKSDVVEIVLNFAT